jgi:anti-sigma factor RsiW
MTDEHTDLSCDEVVELVTDYLEGALSDTDRTRFEVHLTYCSGCDRYLDQMRGTIAAVGGLAAAPDAPEAPDELLDAFRGWKQRTQEE